MEGLLERIADMISTRFRRADHRRRSVTSGRDFISNCQQVVLLIGQNPASATIFNLSTTLVNTVNVAFSTEELVELASVGTSLTNSVDVLAQEIVQTSARITSNVHLQFINHTLFS